MAITDLYPISTVVSVIDEIESPTENREKNKAKSSILFSNQKNKWKPKMNQNDPDAEKTTESVRFCVE